MKSLLTVLALFIALPLLHAQVVKPTRVESELGDAIGVLLYRFQAELKADEVLVVRKITKKTGQQVIKQEHIMSTGGPVAVHSVTLINSALMHPDFRGTYIVRDILGASAYENSLLQLSEQSLEHLRFVFADAETGRVTHTEVEWSAKVEPYAEVKRRHPSFFPLKPGAGFGSSFVEHLEP